MTDLQLGLLAIGALVVAGVLAYNRLQERAARRAERAFRSGHADVLLEKARPGAEPAMPEAQRAAAREAPPPAPALPDPRLDYVVALEFSGPVPAGTVLEHWKAHAHLYARRAILAGTVDGTTWRALAADHGGTVRGLRAGIQMVTREGAASEAELIEFRAAAESLAAATGARVEAPEMKQAVEAARELDRFCADADIQVVFHVVPPPGGTFAGARVHALAEASGMVPGDDDGFALFDADGRVLFTLAAHEGSHEELSLVLDVPRAPDTRRSFLSMAGFAQQLSAALGGSLVDDNGNPLEERALAAIAAQLDAVRGTFDARGFAPGGAEALRLFS